MRSQKEIVDRIAVEKENDPLRLSIDDLISRLTFETATKEGIVADDAIKEEWIDAMESADPEYVKKDLVVYLAFAWEKALGHRWISANRSIGHIRNFLWLIGDDEALAFVEDDSNYFQYGVPILKYVSDRYGYTNYPGQC